MNLISLLIALAAQKRLSSKVWQFNYYFEHITSFYQSIGALKRDNKQIEPLTLFALIILPVIGCFYILNLIDDTILYLIASTLILIVSFGCTKTYEAYKSFLQAANRDEPTTCELTLLQLKQDKNLPDLPFGETMVWLNYRYYMAPMLIFVIFGPVATLLYRLVLTFSELTANNEDSFYLSQKSQQYIHTIFSLLDWPLVRIVSFAYMLVGHFSKAMPTYLDSFLDFDKPAHQVLTNVAKQSEDFMVDEDDCVAEPCLLVKLAKRTLLLMLSVVAVLTITGVIN